MGIQQIIDNINKLGYQVTIDIDCQGYIVAGVFHKPDSGGMSASVLEPANEMGNDLKEVLEQSLKRLNKQMAMESKS